MEKIKILMADDHPVVRAGIRGMLETQPEFEVIAEAENGREAFEQIGKLKPDVVLMDLRMPEMDGVEAIGKIKEKYPDTNILVLTTYDTDADIVRAVEAGATGYLLKDAPREELFRAVRGTAKGETVLAPVVAARLMGKVRDHGEQALSAREIDVLMLVARGASNQDVAEKLHVSTATVKSHLMQIYQKLGVSDRTAAVTTAIERGIIRLS
ncbi:MAG TPA: response regulator transcription factor [Anaerolineales bacterium]|nr:response regulator transcription factor [Anaerolineales bacterium]